MAKNPDFSTAELNSAIKKIRLESVLEKSTENLKLIFSLIDLTTLNTDDTSQKVISMCDKVNGLQKQFPGMTNVGAICVYPAMVAVVKENLDYEGVGIASVAAGFPSSQTFFSIKELECKLAVAAGATEIDIVISVGKWLEKDRDYIQREISSLKEVINPAKLKVILETGLLPSPDDIYDASMASMRAGADFIKTSTGKIQPAATPEAVFIMCNAIKSFNAETGKKIGIKPAGGISSPDQALEYASIVKYILGEDWLNPTLFRIGASRLANHILSDIALHETGLPADSNYF